MRIPDWMKPRREPKGPKSKTTPKPINTRPIGKPPVSGR